MKFLAAIAAALAMTFIPGTANCQANYPSKPVRLLVGFAAGGPADIIARILSDKLAEAWGQPIVIENVAGAGGNIGGERVAKAASDGYTLLMATNAQLTVNPILYDKMAFDPLRDLTTISQIVSAPNILVVNKDVPATNVQELVALARSQPGKLTFGSAGVGTTQHLAGELFKSLARLDIRHVPYRGAVPVITDLIGGHVSMFFGSASPLIPLIRDGKVRALAVTSPRRFSVTPDLPTMIEAGFPGFDASVSFGLMAPAGTPPGIISRIHRAVVAALALPDVRRRRKRVRCASASFHPRMVPVLHTKPSWSNCASSDTSKVEMCWWIGNGWLSATINCRLSRLR
jgi:tripartite-type tricarboxylate transporter receptor subunit TctC